MRKGIFILLFSVFLVFQQPVVSRAGVGCSASPSSFLKIFTESIWTLYNIFPIEIAGVPIEIVHLPTANSLGGSPICICIQGSPPVPRLGITFSWWNPQAVIETVKAPFCFPSLGFGLGSMGGKYFGEGKAATDAPSSSQTTSNKKPKQVYLNVHYIKYPTIILLDILTDVSCMSIFENGIDLFYMSEVDPTWKDDELSTVINPESVLFANPIAQFACLADAVASDIGFSLDPLFWCMGSWGSSYPLAGNKTGDMKESSAGLAARTVYRMTRMLMLWQTIGRGALCQPIPMPIWIKSQYSIFEAYPKLWPKRMPLGKSGIIWSAGANPPVPKKDDNIVWFLYQHHDCCLF